MLCFAFSLGAFIVVVTFSARGICGYIGVHNLPLPDSHKCGIPTVCTVGSREDVPLVDQGPAAVPPNFVRIIFVWFPKQNNEGKLPNPGVFSSDDEARVAAL